MAYDYTPVPSYTAPTEGNMQQAATEIANWLRTKGDGKDVRESLAQAVQLFGDVAAQFIKQSEGLKGQFSSAIANANTNSEVEAARNSTISGTGYTTLGDRLDAIEDGKSTVVDVNSVQDINAQKNFKDGLLVDGSKIEEATDTGWRTDNVVVASWVQVANSGSNSMIAWRIIDFGIFKIVCIKGSLTVVDPAGAGTSAVKFASIPVDDFVFNYWSYDGNTSMRLYSGGDIVVKPITSSSFVKGNFFSLNRIFIV